MCRRISLSVAILLDNMFQSSYRIIVLFVHCCLLSTPYSWNDSHVHCLLKLNHQTRDFSQTERRTAIPGSSATASLHFGPFARHSRCNDLDSLFSYRFVLCFVQENLEKQYIWLTKPIMEPYRKSVGGARVLDSRPRKSKLKLELI